MDLFIIILLLVFGIVIGGVLNTLADDLPFHRRVKFPPRYRDGTPRPRTAWLGITAFLLGQRRPAGEQPETVEFRFGETETGEPEYTITLPNHLSWRYPLTELSTAGAFVIAYLTAVTHQINLAQFAFWLIYMAIFVLVIVVDVEHRLILFAVMIPSFGIALVDALLTTVNIANSGPNLVDTLIGGALGFGVFYAFYLGGFVFTAAMSKTRGKQIDEVAFGYGDVMMMTLAGLILGWRAAIFTMFIAVMLGALGAFLYLLLAVLLRNRYQAFTALPYGPYIVIATALMLLFQDAVGAFLGAYFPPV